MVLMSKINLKVLWGAELQDEGVGETSLPTNEFIIYACL
jgi:hypothetical protein